MGSHTVNPRPARTLVPVGCLLLAACCLLLAACGDDSDTTSSSSTTSAAQPGELSVDVQPGQAGPGTTVNAAVVNDTESQFTYGAAYELERLVDGEFEQVKLPERPVIQIAYVAGPGETGPAVAVDVPGSATPGTYRVVIQRDVPAVGDLNGEFEVVGDE